MTYMQFNHISIVRCVQRKPLCSSFDRYCRYSLDRENLDPLIDSRDEIEQTDGARTNFRFVQFYPVTYIQFQRIAIVRYVQRRMLVLLSIATAANRYTKETRINSTPGGYVKLILVVSSIR